MKPGDGEVLVVRDHAPVRAAGDVASEEGVRGLRRPERCADASDHAGLRDDVRVEEDEVIVTRGVHPGLTGLAGPEPPIARTQDAQVGGPLGEERRVFGAGKRAEGQHGDRRGVPVQFEGGFGCLWHIGRIADEAVIRSTYPDGQT